VGTLGLTAHAGWRVAMLIAGLVCALAGVGYYFLTQDAPEGNFRDLRATGRMADKAATRGTFREACRDRRVWALFAVYGACFGLELTIDNVAALYFFDYFEELRNADPLNALETAGLFAGLFGGMNLFARALGGIIGDKFGARWGLSGRVKWLFLALFCEGVALLLFSQARTLVTAVPLL